jgi:hypothetical protein
LYSETLLALTEGKEELSEKIDIVAFLPFITLGNHSVRVRVRVRVRIRVRVI